MSRNRKRGDKVSNSSEGSSQSDSSKVSNYLTYDLLRDVTPQSTKKVSIIEDTTISNDPTIERIVWEAAQRDLHVVSNAEAALKADQKQGINQVLASIICYKKVDDEAPKTIRTFQIISPEWMLVEGKPFSDDGRPNYRDEVKEGIFEVEMGFFSDVLREKSTLLTNKSEELEENLLVLDREAMPIRDEIIALKKLKRQNKGKNPEEELEENNKQMELKIKEYDEKITKLESKLEEFYKNNNYLQKQEQNKSYKKELQNIKDLSNTLLADSIKGARGHSEDYLYYFLNDERGKQYIKDQIPEDSDRVYLVISSTRDACRRCCWKVEEMVDIISKSLEERNKALSTDPAKPIICKALYFSNQEMKDKDGKSSVNEYKDSPITEGNLSSSESSAIHFRPSSTTAENRVLSPTEERLKSLTFASRNLRIREELDKQSKEGTPSPIVSTASSPLEEKAQSLTFGNDKSRISKDGGINQ